MTRRLPGVTRRRLLSAGIATTGILGFTGGARALLRSEPVEHTRSTVVSNNDLDLEVNWAEWYNDERIETQEFPTDNEGATPILTLADVLPGDQGRVHFGLTIEDGSGSADSSTAASVAMRLVPMADAFAENGRTEPELVGGDSTPETGELQDHVETRIWYDTGGALSGACNGAFDIGESLITDDTEGSLASVIDALEDWTDLDANPGQPDDDCLEPEEELCIGLEWALPDDIETVADNTIQSDSVRFQIAFRVELC